MNDERKRILEMLQNGKLSAAEALDLLNALDDPAPKPAAAADGGRFLRVRVQSERSKVNVNLPLNLLRVVGRLASVGLKLIPEEARREMANKGIDLANFDIDELIRLVDQGLVDGKIVDVDTDDPREGRTKVEVYVE